MAHHFLSTFAARVWVTRCRLTINMTEPCAICADNLRRNRPDGNGSGPGLIGRSDKAGFPDCGVMWFSHMTAGRCGRGGFTRPVMPANAARHCMVLAVGATVLHGGYVGKRCPAWYGVGCWRGGFTRWVCRQTLPGIAWYWPLARRLYTVSMSANAAWHCMALTVGAAALHGRTYRQTRLGTVWR